MYDTETAPGSHHVNDPAWPTRVSVACANFSTMPRQKAASVDKLIATMHDAAGRDADLVIFPELAINSWGRCTDCAAAHRPCEWHLAEAEAADGPSATRIAAAASELGVHVIYGFEEAGDVARGDLLEGRQARGVDAVVVGQQNPHYASILSIPPM